MFPSGGTVKNYLNQLRPVLGLSTMPRNRAVGELPPMGCWGEDSNLYGRACRPQGWHALPLYVSRPGVIGTPRNTL